MRDKISDKESKTMSTAYISSAKGMAQFLLAKEHRGPGDTIEAAAARLQRKLKVPSSILMRLRHREVKDMLMSNFLALANAYSKACEKLDEAYEKERKFAVDPNILRLAALVAGKEDETTTKGRVK
ncbi:hypothetical protein CN221_11265 [Sinorhizobium meliloti]|uniref:hypothetical protein n=1 Tax=Rhizobium meliloti TaxID=382 RepID=UPI000B49758A|nr:hypothetical protein [Sinorhizobium meliloti]ASP84144.1 hypothetical protein CDO26_05685 [Sinorhizobium meliloti]MQW26300.1 hypothetical protein [Sinorhizobium meliloti]RVG96716.1 hypothetical protein CN221_11265 [Sinorhizobium meliloti]RVH53613.1 hypothetical protein CN209_36585 [Sinorhizobium meliloti]